VESPSLERFQTRLDKVLHSLLWVTLLRQGVGLGDPQRSLPCCDSVILSLRCGELLIRSLGKVVRRSKPSAPGCECAAAGRGVGVPAG